jgi:transposase
MSSIIQQKIGKYVYLYESSSFRNEDGKPRNTRKIIGKIDPLTGNYIYKAEYIERMAQNGTPVQVNEQQDNFSLDEILQSSIKEFGSSYLFQSLSEKSGLMAILRNVFVEKWQKIFALACYLVACGEPAMYFEDWLYKTESVFRGTMSSQRVSELIATISVEDRTEFYSQWVACRSEQEYLALDTTSISSYSELISDVEWGYNRDGEDLPQVNLCMLLGEKSRLPVFQSLYSGSLKDVSTLKNILSLVSSVSTQKILIVMDKGFCSKKNIDELLANPEKMRFIIAAPFSMNFVKNQVISEKKDIDSLQNTIVIGEDVLRGISRTRKWSNGTPLTVHSFFNAVKAVKMRENLYAHVTLLKQEAEKNPTKSAYQADFKRYLHIRKSEKNECGYTVNIRQDVVDKELEHAGWLILLSNDITDAKEAISIYRAKDVVEKGFLMLKNSLELGRIRVHSENSMQNKVFIGFIALIIMASIHNVMMDKGLYRNMTMQKLLKTLDKLRVQRINGKSILFPVTKEQKEIFKTFGLQIPV